MTSNKVIPHQIDASEAFLTTLKMTDPSCAVTRLDGPHQ